MMSIKDNMPWEGGVHEILELNVLSLKDFLRIELEIEQAKLQEQIFEKSLERIFIENRLYKPIETLSDYEQIHLSIENGLKPFCEHLLRQPTREDREKLLGIPIRRISLFDLEKNRNEIAAAEKDLAAARSEAGKVTSKRTGVFWGAAGTTAGAGAGSGRSSVKKGSRKAHDPCAFSLLPCFQTLTTSMSRARVAASPA